MNSFVRDGLFAARISRVAIEKGVGTVPVPRVVSGRKRSTLCVRVQGSFPLSGFPGRAVAKANDPCHPGMASATAPKYPRQSWLLKQPGALLHGIDWTADPGDGKASVAKIVGSVPLSDVSVTSAQRGCTTCKIQRAK